MKDDITREHIDYIMDTFDFRKVSKFMKMLGWKWHTEDGFCVPDEYELRQKARWLLSDVVSKGLYEVKSGGFTARKEGNLLSLSFYIEESEVEP